MEEQMTPKEALDVAKEKARAQRFVLDEYQHDAQISREACCITAKKWVRDWLSLSTVKNVPIPHVIITALEDYLSEELHDRLHKCALHDSEYVQLLHARNLAVANEEAAQELMAGG